MTNPEVYVIEWRKSLKVLCEYLTSNGGYLSASAIFRWSSKEKRLVETNDKTIVICPAQTIAQLEANNEEQFKGKVHPYDWETFPNPDSEQGETHNLHVAGIPNDFDESDAVRFIHTQLAPIISPDSYKTDFKLRSRTTGQISGFGEITFNPGVDLYIIKLCKLMLHNKPLESKRGTDRSMMVRCVWHKVAPIQKDVKPKKPIREGEWRQVPMLNRKVVRVRPITVDLTESQKEAKPKEEPKLQEEPSVGTQ